MRAALILLVLLVGCETPKTEVEPVMTEVADLDQPFDLQVIGGVGVGAVEVPIRLVNSYGAAIPGGSLTLSVDGFGSPYAKITKYNALVDGSTPFAAFKLFYDYDELCLLEECNFRRLPPTDRYEEELAAEPWFHINTNDIFPEEFPNFLGLSGSLRAVFESAHGDLYTVDYWRARQDGIRAGERAHIFPYQAGQRLH